MFRARARAVVRARAWVRAMAWARVRGMVKAWDQARITIRVYVKVSVRSMGSSMVRLGIIRVRFRARSRFYYRFELQLSRPDWS